RGRDPGGGGRGGGPVPVHALRAGVRVGPVRVHARLVRRSAGKAEDRLAIPARLGGVLLGESVRRARGGDRARVHRGLYGGAGAGGVHAGRNWGDGAAVARCACGACGRVIGRAVRAEGGVAAGGAGGIGVAGRGGGAEGSL